MNCAMFDATVTFVKNRVAPTTWWAPASKAGGEVIRSDSYRGGGAHLLQGEAS